MHQAWRLNSWLAPVSRICHLALSFANTALTITDSYRHPERYVAQSAEVRKLAKDLLDWEASEAAPKYPKDAKDLYDTRFEFRYPLTTLQNGRKESIKVVFSLITYLIEQMASASDENGALLQALGIDEEDEEASRGQMPTPERVRNEMLHVQFAGCKAKLRVMYELLRAAGINGQLPGLKAEELEDILTQFEAAERQAPAEST